MKGMGAMTAVSSMLRGCWVDLCLSLGERGGRDQGWQNAESRAAV